jgi:amidophosphoribosyltransferase
MAGAERQEYFSRANSESDRIQSNCGLFAIIYVGENPDGLDLKSIVLDAGADLQQRAQGAAGYAVFDGDGESTLVKGLGKIDVAFQNGCLLPSVKDSRIAILHTRYATAGGSDHVPNIQPLTFNGLTLAHHGNLTNAEEIRANIGNISMGGNFPDNDSWIALNAVDQAPGNSLAEKLINAQKQFEGGWAFIASDGKNVVASRDPQGIRPLFLATVGPEENPQAFILSVESAPFRNLEIDKFREVLPGETILIEGKKVITADLSPAADQRSCIFEMVYMMNLHSEFMGKGIYTARRQAGHFLWQEQPVSLADDEELVVMSIPNSGRPSGLGYYQEARKTLGERVYYDEGIVASSYVGRNFIQPAGERSPRKKFSPIEELLRNKIVVLIDDSLVRGETMTGILKMALRSGAKEVHVRLASPPIVRPCFWGVAMSTYTELAANNFPDINDRARELGANSLGYLSLEGLFKACGVDNREKFCAHCFGGNSPHMDNGVDGIIQLMEAKKT